MSRMEDQPCIQWRATAGEFLQHPLQRRNRAFSVRQSRVIFKFNMQKESFQQVHDMFLMLTSMSKNGRKWNSICDATSLKDIVLGADQYYNISKIYM